jgi:hypothetical protein
LHVEVAALDVLEHLGATHLRYYESFGCAAYFQCALCCTLEATNQKIALYHTFRANIPICVAGYCLRLEYLLFLGFFYGLDLHFRLLQWCWCFGLISQISEEICSRFS